MKVEKRVKPAQFPRSFTDVAYADGSQAQKLDIFLPEGTGPFPLIVFIHGGGWLLSDKRAEPGSGTLKLVSQGYAVATLNYRFSDEALWPAQLYDVKAAVRFLRANEKRFDLQTDRILVWGNSAGGHLAQMLAATNHMENMEDLSMGNPEASSAVTALISWFGVSEFPTLDEQYQMLGVDIGRSLTDETSTESRLIGGAIQKNPTKAKEASPIEYVTKEFPAAFLQHGTADRQVPYLQSVKLAEHINQICGETRAELQLLPCGHGAPEMRADANIIRCLTFADTYFGFTRDYNQVHLPQLEFEEVLVEERTLF